MPFWGKFITGLADRKFLKAGIRHLFYDRRLSNEFAAWVMKYSDLIRPNQEILYLSSRHLGLKGIRSGALVLDKLPRIECPTLFIYGAQDKIFPLAHAKVEIIERAGHIPQIEQAEVFNKLVREFLVVGSTS
jgi:pimeloyl-ACP methyl ester carboxylesterase